MKASEAFLKNEDAQGPPQIDWKRISRRGFLFLKAFSPEDSLVLQLTSLAQAFILAFENHCSESSPQMASTKIPYSLSVGQGEYSLTCATWCYLLLKIWLQAQSEEEVPGGNTVYIKLGSPSSLFSIPSIMSRLSFATIGYGFSWTPVGLGDMCMRPARG